MTLCKSLTTRITSVSVRRSSAPRRNTRGVALVELLLFTIPLTILAIVLASALAATSSAKQKAAWQASLKAQKATTQPCGGVPLLMAPTMSSKQGQFSQGLGKANVIAMVGTPITLTGMQTEKATERPPSFYFESAADKMFPNRTRSVENSATFPCNEPDHGDSRRDLYKAVLIPIGLGKAKELF